MDSVLDTEKGKCYVCGREGVTHRHHICFGVGMRSLSEHYGLIVYLCPECHTGTHGVHGRDGDAMNRFLKAEAQKRFEELHSHEEWMMRIGRSYI